MPFTDTVSSLSGRNSRASNVSGQSRSQHSSAPTSTNDTWSNAGVLSMLKTSTDTGDIGALSFNNSRLPGMPTARNRGRHAHRSKHSASGHPHITSLSSNHSYAPSQTSRISSQWDNGSTTQRRGSFTSLQSMPPSIPPMQTNRPPMPLQQVPQDMDPRSSRSYSMGSSPSGSHLPRHQSAASLKSQGHEPRHANMPPGPVPPMPENRPPFVYPTRLKRPGFRSPSPALSDSYAGPPMGQMPRRAPGPHPPPMTAYNGYNVAYMGEYAMQQPNMRPPPPARADTSPGLGYGHSQYAYQQGPMRQPPLPGMPHQMQQPYPPQYPDQPMGTHMPGRAHPGPQCPPGYTYPPYGPAQAHGRSRGPPPPSNVGPMAHHMFHNAARMARNLPHRTDTPMTDGGVPSSDPASSSSAPDSSSPPTPRDGTSVRVVVDPAFIEPDLVDLTDSSEPMLPGHKYFEYAEGRDEQQMEVQHASIPPPGFVQRVKAMLESKAALEAAQQHEHEKAMQLSHPQHLYLREVDADAERDGDVSELMDVHEMAANETPRFTVIEEFEAPVELPASPVKIAELDAIEANRITRDMIRAELSCISSVDNTLEQVQPDESTANVIKQLVERGDDPEPPVQSAAKHELARHSRRSSRQSVNSMKRRQDSVPEAIAEATVEISLPTGADYAMRFQVPVDTTDSYDETQSRDPFALDADTVTLQHQAAAAKEASRVEHSESGKQTPRMDPKRQTILLDLTPVSPLRPGEEVKRSSAVSPVQDDARGIEQTLQVAGGVVQPDESTAQESTTSDCLSVEIDSVSPSSPRTPKTYSKSVQLHRPSVAATDVSNTNSNRFSLPGDLSSVGDTTINSGTDMITDVAICFNLPGTTITVGKPQIIDVSHNSTPDKPKDESPNYQPHFTKQAGLRSSRRNSVTFADEIAPLNIKKAEPTRSDTASSQHKSIIRKPTPRNDSAPPSRPSQDGTTDLRPIVNSTTYGTHTRLGSGQLYQLPGLKEESVEDMSSPEKRRSTNHSDFPLPARIAAVKAMQERRLRESADNAKARRAVQKHNRPLGDSRDLPSLNFSRTNLFEKLNDALEVRPTKSMDVIRRRDFTGIHCPSPQRPLSTEPLRDRYASFFNKPEDFSFCDGVVTSDEDDEGLDSEPEEEFDNSKALVPIVQVQEHTQTEAGDGAKGNRPLSPEDFLHVAQQASRLSIPSVAGLSERISELIPGLRNLSNLRLDYLLPSDGEMHPGFPASELGRPDTILTNRTSAGFRTLAERAEEIVINGTHDSIAPSALHALLNKELPPLPGSTSADELSGMSSVDGKTSYLSGSVSVPVDLGRGLARPSSALLHAKAPTTEEEVQNMLPRGMNPISRMSNKRSQILSQPNSRPWNVDKNYPWSGNSIEIDLLVPSPAHTRKSLASDVLRERRTRSLDIPSTSRSTTATASRAIDLGSITTSPAGSRFSINTEHLTGVSPVHLRHKSKLSIIGSITKKFGLTSGRSTALDGEGGAKSLSTSPVPRQMSVASHKPGDRYPTSSLTPPAIAALDEVRSFFSDNSSERNRTASFRKRLTHFKGKSKTSRADMPGRSARSLDIQGNTEYSAGSINEARSESAAMHMQYDAAGMGKAEFHIKRFGEKLRHFFARGSELFRNISTRGRPRKNEPRDEWLADSLYSGPLPMHV
ncbi:hypothetical protein Slin15195_G127710 [Septoria linicola]|uniref:Uncharacterized protein n=1 Tax=Septoria linicola TaxID=215465 RepID=A0A9Q9B0H8_9PEZI|nr:hypothetical protein Slin15195_G127710 [Septoria linicola]